MSRRAVEPGVRIPRRVISAGIVLACVVGASLLAVGLSALARANEPITVATSEQLAVQQGAVERGIERAYEQATEQVRRVRALNLAITAAQADAIAGKALSDLRTLRHNAFVSLGGVLGLSDAESESYATRTEQRFDTAPVSAAPSPTPVLLAPRLYTIVSRMSELATRIADQATAALTAPASPAPSPSPTTRPTPSPSPAPTRP